MSKYKMKTTLLIGLFVCMAFQVGANNRDVAPVKGDFGKNIIAGKSIVGVEYQFPEIIEHLYIEGESNCITVEQRVTFISLYSTFGRVIMYDLAGSKTLWEKPIDYQKYSLVQNGRYLFRSGGGNSTCLDFTTGRDLWKTQSTIAFYNPDLGIGVGYMPCYSVPCDSIFEGINLKNGRTVWKRDAKLKSGPDEIFMINDTVAMVVASGLHTINLKNGKGWDYEAVTGSYSLRAYKTGMISNVIVDSSDIYFASKEKVSRLDLNGRVIWSTPLPKNLTSGSNIMLMDSTLFMVNSGSCDILYSEVKKGKPYIAAFDIKTGNKKYLNTIDDKKGIIIESVVGEKELNLLYKNKIAKCTVGNGTLLSENSYDTGVYGELVRFVRRSIYIKCDSAYRSLTDKDTLNDYVHTSKNTILAIDKNLNVVKQYNPDQFYNYYMKYKGYRFLRNMNGTIVIDENDAVVAKIDISAKASKVGSKLYFVREKSVIVIDLNDIVAIPNETPSHPVIIKQPIR